MPSWMLGHLFVWSVRIGVLVTGALTMKHLVEGLGYRVDLPTMLISAVLVIVTVRLWMPWGNPPDRNIGA